VPRTNLDAEKSLLGGVLLDSQAFAEVWRSSGGGVLRDAAPQGVRGHERAVRQGPAHRPDHGQDELTAQALSTRFGGDEFIDLLDKIVPTAANLAYYAKYS